MKRLYLALATASLLGLAFSGCSEEPLLNDRDEVAVTPRYAIDPDLENMTWGHAPLEPGEKCVSEISGPQTVAVLAVHFNNTPPENHFTPSRVAAINNIMFGASNSVGALYEEMSFGSLSYSGNVFGPFTIDIPSSTPCNQYPLMKDLVDDQAYLAIPGFEDYDYYIYVFARPNSCQDDLGWGGVAQMCGQNVWIWTWQSRSVYAHELGHTLGWLHSGTPELGEYGDYSCIMSTNWHHNGFDLSLREASAIWKNEAGWIAPERVLAVETAGNYEFYLAPAEREPGLILDPTGGTAYQLIRVDYLDGNLNTRHVYLSYRREEGSFYPVPAVADLMNRIHVHTQIAPGYHTWRQAALAASEFFELGPVAITAVTDGLGGDGDHFVRVEVDIRETPPGVGINPTVLRVADPQEGVVVGTVQLQITNNATSKLTSTTYTLEPSAQQGFLVQPETASVTLAPGESTTIAVDLVTTPDIYDGRFPYGVTVTDDAGVQGSSVASARFDADLEPPTVPGNLRHDVSLGIVTLQWDQSDDTWGVDQYEIRRNGQIVGVSPRWSPRYVDNNVNSGIVYEYEVRAYDIPGHISDWSPPYSVLLDCEHGVDSWLETPIVFANKPPKRLPFIVPANLYITNQNGEECGPSAFTLNVTVNDGNPVILPVPEDPATIVIGAGATAGGFGGMNFTALPTEGEYSINLAIKRNYVVLANHDFKYVLDETPPTTPSLVRANLVGTQVRLTWRGSTDALSGLAHYDVLRDGVVVGQPTNAAFNDQLGSVSPGQMICYQVRAVDRAGNESPLSTTACVTIPNMEDPLVP